MNEREITIEEEGQVREELYHQLKLEGREKLT